MLAKDPLIQSLRSHEVDVKHSHYTGSIVIALCCRVWEKGNSADAAFLRRSPNRLVENGVITTIGFYWPFLHLHIPSPLISTLF